MTDPWSPPEPQSSQFPATPTRGQGDRRLLERIYRLERLVNDMRNNLLKTAGMSVEPGLIRFGGAVAIEGTLSLPGGIIGNEALASPVAFRSTFANANAFSLSPLSGGDATVCSSTITVPEGFTTALVQAISLGYAYNTTATLTYGYLRTYVETPDESWWSRRLLEVMTASGGSASLTVPCLQALTNLTPGSQITVRSTMNSDTISVPAHASNGVTITASALFGR